MAVITGPMTPSARHELNNALAALMAETQLLQMDETLERDQVESVNRIVSHARRLRDLLRTFDAPVAKTLSADMLEDDLLEADL